MTKRSGNNNKKKRIKKTSFIFKVTSEEVVKAYIARIQEVNPFINAVVEDRFAEAIEDAKRADQIIQTKPLLEIMNNYPILGVPFTVKESCSLKGTQLSPVDIDSTDLLGILCN